MLNIPEEDLLQPHELRRWICPYCDLASVRVALDWQAECGWCERINGTPAVLVGNELMLLELEPKYLREYVASVQEDEQPLREVEEEEENKC